MGKGELRRARRTVDVSPGESVRILRELQELSQNELSGLTGIPQSTISAIERVKVGVELAKVLARVLPVSPVGSWTIPHFLAIQL